ncbi:MAG: hypothetical protein BWY28_00275 [bacterium ADurb.Bin236]|nr:MAG: hypothetical protein BWY28_00275 [bacterium ADurb.Bin236]
MRHQGDQGGLAHIGGFSGHVGAGDDEQALLPAHQGIVGHEGALRHRPLDHRVAALPDFQAPLAVEGGPGVAVFLRAARQSLQRVQGLEPQRQRLQVFHPQRHPVQHLSVQLVFKPRRLLLRAQRAALQLRQLLRYKALGVGQGLPADIARRHQRKIGLGDLDEITEDAVVEHLEVLDACRLALPLLQVAEPLAAVAGCQAGLVQPRVIPLPDGAAVRELGRGIPGDGPLQQVLRLLLRPERLQKGGKARLGQPLQQRPRLMRLL